MFKRKIEVPRNTVQQPRRTKESKLLMAKCASTKKDYVIRIDKKVGENEWHMAYSFPFNETLRGDSSVARKNETLQIGENTDEYNYCPFCEGSYTNLCCYCGTWFCSTRIGRLTCPSCGKTDDYSPTTTFDVKSSAF